MHIQLLSDLHLDTRDWEFFPFLDEPDIALIPGDLADGARLCEDSRLQFVADTFREQWPQAKILFVPGNHDYYGLKLSESRAMFQRMRELGWIVLDREKVIIDGVRFLGATLWTRFYETQNDEIVQHIHNNANDFRAIWDDQERPINPRDLAQWRNQDYWFLESELAKPFNGKTVVATHFLPSYCSIDTRWIGHFFNSYMVGDAEDLAQQYEPEIWVHGHTHENVDIQLGKTRFVCNPWGHVKEERGFKYVSLEI